VKTAATSEFADAMSTLASGVVLVTCLLDGRPWGMTVTAFASVSADPPTILVSLCTRAVGARALAAARRFGVSVLADEHVDVARYCSAPGAPKFLEQFIEAGDGGSASPAVAGALAHLDCELADAVRVADHTVYIGRVRVAWASHDGTPLLYHRRDYHTTEWSTPWLAS
jgi:flavin reductase (DIM6/NTAB) family NADH-FMN oxidoreductase RutF